MIGSSKSMTFNGHYPEEYGAVLSSLTATVPAPRQITDTVPYRDGVYDFSRFDGSLHYDNLTITCVFHIVASDTDEMYDKLHKLTNWLHSDGENVLCDEREAFWHFEEVFCTGIETEFLLNDKTAIQVTATMSANPYKVSNSGIKAEPIKIYSYSGFLAYKPDTDNLKLCWFDASDFKSYTLADETITTTDGQHVVVTLTKFASDDSVPADLPMLISIPRVTSATWAYSYVSIIMNGKEYLPEYYGSDSNYSFYVPKRLNTDGTTNDVSIRFTFNSSLTSDDIAKVTYLVRGCKNTTTTTEHVDIGYDVVPLTVESSGLPTLTIYSGSDPNSDNTIVTYGPTESSIDLKAGLYYVTLSGTRQVTLTYNSTKRRL